MNGMGVGKMRWDKEQEVGGVTAVVMGQGVLRCLAQDHGPDLWRGRHFDCGGIAGGTGGVEGLGGLPVCRRSWLRDRGCG